MTPDESAVTVLCVDDEPGFADLVAVCLEESDKRISVTTATGPREALEQLNTTDIKCIVSDYNMPEMDGLELFEAVRTAHPNLPFVLYTGVESSEIASKALSAGVTDYMQKGTVADQSELLAQRVHNAVARHRTQEAESRARTVIKSFSDAVLTTAAAEIVHANHSACELFDVDSRAELTGIPVADLFLSDDVDTLLERISAEATQIDCRIRTLTGEAIPVELTARQTTWNGDDGLVVIVRDHSEQD